MAAAVGRAHDRTIEPLDPAARHAFMVHLVTLVEAGSAVAAAPLRLR
jgi:hypothetical protein